MFARIPKVFLLPLGAVLAEAGRFFLQQVLTAYLPQDKTMSVIDRGLAFLAEMVLGIPPWFLGGVAVGMFVVLLWERRRRASSSGKAAAKAFDPAGLYVGEICVDAEKAIAEHYLEIEIRAFNGTGVTISVDHLSGGISFATMGASGPIYKLPAARLMVEREGLLGIEHNSQFRVFIEQRLPGEFTKAFPTDPGQPGIYLDLASLWVRVNSVSATGEWARLPIWDGLRMDRVANKLVIGRLASASIKIQR
jgi:hypothetical protein